jgi:hypothetical protein
MLNKPLPSHFTGEQWRRLRAIKKQYDEAVVKCFRELQKGWPLAENSARLRELDEERNQIFNQINSLTTLNKTP